MGNHVADEVGLPSVHAFKVHARMCFELLRLVTRISKIFPELEDARPRCSSGIEALCVLNDGVAEAKSRLQHCTESSALYLALTGNVLLSRFCKYRRLFDQRLTEIQNMVPVMLAAKISRIVTELRSTEFCLDLSEAEAGKILQDLLRNSSAGNNYDRETALASIHEVSSRLHIVSQKALLIEKRSIKKMLDNSGESEKERGKRGILLFFLDLLKKYGKTMPLEQKVNGSSDLEHSAPFGSPYHLSTEVDLCVDYNPSEAQIGMLSRLAPPDEFLCLLSLRLMYDPVEIASGQTYERMWIEKWFKEGNDTCPKTKMKLPNLLFTSNTCIQARIAKWCAEHGVSIPDPSIHDMATNSWETSSNSIASLTGSMYNLNLPVDFSNISLGSCQDQDQDHSNMEISKAVKSLDEKDIELLSKFSELPWDSRCNAVEVVKKLLKHCNESRPAIPSEKFAQLILTFLKDAYNQHDVEAQMTGCLLLLEFLQNSKNGDGILCIKEDTYNLLASFLDTELSKQALSILEVLSTHQQCGLNIASYALTGILNILDSQIHELLELALHILSNLSSNDEVGSSISLSDIIPKLIPFLEDQTLARHCIAILKNTFNSENGRVLIAKTEGCIASIVKVLEIDDCDAQEHALSILLTLCSQRVEYCHIVMEAGIFNNLLSITVNGNNGAKAAATELLRLLRGVIESTEESSNANATVHWNTPKPTVHWNTPKLGKYQNTPKPSSFLGKVFGNKKK